MATTASTPKAANRPPEYASPARLGVVALVGKRDEPTDALRDYCACLGEALERRGFSAETAEVRWERDGWLAALRKLWSDSTVWQGRWVLLQYTALMWSRRGFPVPVPLILWLLKLRGCRTAIVFHDVYAIPGARWLDRFRVALQVRIMRHICTHAEKAVFPVPVEQVPWLSVVPPNAAFIPIGANIPSIDDLGRNSLPFGPRKGPLAVAIFGMCECGWARDQEIDHLSRAMRGAAEVVGEIDLIALGRGTKEAEPALRKALDGSPVRLTVDGLLGSSEITARLSSCDVSLFLRGPFSSRRGSGLAGLACGLPIVAYEGKETGGPLRDAGILFVPNNDVAALTVQLVRVLRDAGLRETLAQRSRTIFRQWFCWDRVAARFAEVLGG